MNFLSLAVNAHLIGVFLAIKLNLPIPSSWLLEHPISCFLGNTTPPSPPLPLVICDTFGPYSTQENWKRAVYCLVQVGHQEVTVPKNKQN